MWIFGAVDFTAALAKVAKVLGYRVTVCDAREIFATRRRFPMADEVVVSWPGPLFERRGSTLGPPRRGVHPDPRPQVRRAGGAGRARHRRRLHRRDGQPHDARQAAASGCVEAGVDPTDLDRLMSPIGLDLGARTPEETAISICAEIIATRTGKTAPSLKDSEGPIHA